MLVCYWREWSNLNLFRLRAKICNFFVFKLILGWAYLIERKHDPNEITVNWKKKIIIHSGVRRKTLVIPIRLCLILVQNILKKGSKMKFDLQIENVHQNKWVETRVNVFDWTVKNRLNEMEFIYKKKKKKQGQTTVLKHKQKKIWF